MTYCENHVEMIEEKARLETKVKILCEQVEKLFAKIDALHAQIVAMDVDFGKKIELALSGKISTTTAVIITILTSTLMSMITGIVVAYMEHK